MHAVSRARSLTTFLLAGLFSPRTFQFKRTHFLSIITTNKDSTHPLVEVQQPPPEVTKHEQRRRRDGTLDQREWTHNRHANKRVGRPWTHTLPRNTQHQASAHTATALRESAPAPFSIPKNTRYPVTLSSGIGSANLLQKTSAFWALAN